MWDTETGTELFTLTSHESGVRSVAYSPDGNQIVTTSKVADDEDKTARVWDAKTS